VREVIVSMYLIAFQSDNVNPLIIVLEEGD
jgi:hypothetical protein